MTTITDQEALEDLKQMIRKGMDVNAYNEHGYTPLIWAIEQNWGLCISFLLKQGADPNGSKRGDRVSPLEHAIKARKTLATDKLINARANINTHFSGAWNDTPLIWALKHEDWDLAYDCLEAGADVNMRGAFEHTAFRTAIGFREAQFTDAELQDHLALIQQLLDRGADINAQDWLGRTCLYDAAEIGNFNCVCKMLELGADVLPSASSYNALDAAIANGHTDCADLIRAHLARLEKDPLASAVDEATGNKPLPHRPPKRGP